MKSEIKIFPYDNGEIQRVHLVRPESWSELELLQPQWSDKAVDCFYKIYKQFLVPAAPWVFGNIVLFRLPEGVTVPYGYHSGTYGSVADDLTAAAICLRKGIFLMGKKVIFLNQQARQFWQELKDRDCIRIVRGKLPITTVIPIGREAGFMTENEPDAAMKVNGSFFIMDPFDCATPYDHIGANFGLFVKDGIVEQPPMYEREALIVKKDGSVTIGQPDIRQMSVTIGDKTYIHGKNARFYTRPAYPFSPLGRGKSLVIIGRRVAAVCGGSAAVPGCGFVIKSTDCCDVKAGDIVTYGGMEDVAFGIQVGNSIIRDGLKTEGFISRFYNIRGISRIAFPPSLYPLDYNGARAARIAIGADGEGKPMILWAEGAAKLGHTAGVDSCGASLADMARICAELGMVNGVNLDGGGSAQLLVNNQRSLMISDRNTDFTESERPIPMGLIVR